MKTLIELKGGIGREERRLTDVRGQVSGVAYGGKKRKKETEGSCLVPETEMNDTRQE